MKRLVVTTLALALAACSKDKPAATDTAASSSPSASAAAPAAPASAPPAGPVSYAGTYAASPSSLYIPSEDKDYANVKQAKDDGSKMVGEGKLTLTVEPDGKVAGAVESGPAAPAVIDGRADDGAITGTVRRKEPGDDGLTGSFVGKIAGDAVEGTMQLSDANASVLREAKVSAKKK